MSQFLKAQPNKHESLIVDKFTRVSVVQTSYVDHKQPFFFLRNWGVEVWLGGRGLRWGRSRQGTLQGERGWGLDMRFHKILPEAESSSRCTNGVRIAKVWGEEKCAKVPFSHWGQTGKGYFKKDPSALLRPWIRRPNFHTFHIPKGHLPFLYTSAFWLFSSTFSSSFFSSSDEPFSFSPVFQLPCLCRRNDRDCLLTGNFWKKTL